MEGVRHHSQSPLQGVSIRPMWAGAFYSHDPLNSEHDGFREGPVVQVWRFLHFASRWRKNFGDVRKIPEWILLFLAPTSSSPPEWLPFYSWVLEKYSLHEQGLLGWGKSGGSDWESFESERGRSQPNLNFGRCPVLPPSPLTQAGICAWHVDQPSCGHPI